MKTLWTFLGHQKIGLYLGVNSIIIGSFLKIKVQNGEYFWLLEFQIFFGVLEIPVIFFFFFFFFWGGGG